jgi:subtilisin family serine protease
MDFIIPEPVPPKSLPPALFNRFDIEIDALLGAPKARREFKVDGKGLAVAVLDTGLRVGHKCFTGRVVAQRNFTGGAGQNPDDVTDTNGHGTNVAGIIAAGTADERRGIAPAANVVPLKVLPAPTMQPILDALVWINENASRFGITVANLSLGVPGVNLQDDSSARSMYPDLHSQLRELNRKRIALVVAAGNDYKAVEAEGMSLPAIYREVISVGAVYDASVGEREYGSGAVAYTTKADQITPFSQRLSREASPDCYTDIFSAGATATSAGHLHDDDTSMQDGTSQAAPTVAGVVLLMQQHYLRLTGELPPVSLLQEVFRSTSTWVHDVDLVAPETDFDNVKASGRKYPRINAFESLVALDRAVKLGTASQFTDAA